MKRLLGFLLLCLVTLTAYAEDDLTQTVLALYPAADICACVQEGATAFVALDEGENVPHRLLGFERTDGTWVLTIDNATALLPQYRTRSGGYRYQSHKGLTLTLTDGMLTASYESLGQITENYIFRQVDGAWRFVRHEKIDWGNRMRLDLDFVDGVATQSRTDTASGESEITPPCPMPWLEEAALLSAFDASAFPTLLYDLDGTEHLARVAELLLPDYEYVGGKFWVNAASFLMYNADGELVFLGGTYADGAWAWAESNPLPADTGYDDYHSSGDSFSIGFDHPADEVDEWGDDIYIKCIISLCGDGSWRVTNLFNSGYEWMDFGSGTSGDDVTPGLYISLTGLIYGECTLERDITKVDWSTFPLSVEEVMSYMSRDWGVVGNAFGDDLLPLYADAAQTTLLAEYTLGTPVHIFEREGNMALVQIADSDVTGWLDESGLLLGGDQLLPESLWDDEAMDGYWITADWLCQQVEVEKGTVFYAAPEGDVLHTVGYGAWLHVMSYCDNGWYHVRFTEDARSFYVRAEDCKPVE